MNRRASNRHNPFKDGQSNQGNNQQNEFQHEYRNASQSQNRSFNGPSSSSFNGAGASSSFNHGKRNFQHNNDSQQEPQRSPFSQNNRSYNESSANNSTPSPQQQSTPRTGPCVLCKSATVLICSRCGDFYCSPTCQKNDWQTHRYICFPMPKLVSSSTDIYQNVPALNGYQNRELPETFLDTQNIQSQNKKWVSNSSPTHSLKNNQPQRQQNQQQRNQPQPQPHQSNQQNQPIAQQHQNQNQRQQKQNQNDPKQNRPNPPKSSSSVNGSEKAYDPNDMIKATNIGKVEQVAFPKSNSLIKLTAIRSSNRVFLRSLEKAENEGYLNVLKAINEYGRNASPLKVMPTKNAFAITNFGSDGIFYRVQVVSAKDEDHIHVIYFDFGNEGTKKLSELKDISMECAALKQYIVMATLKNVPFVRDNPKLLEYMKTFEESDGKIVYNDREKPSCDIIFDGVEDSFNKKINVYIQKTKNEPAEEQERLPKPQQPKAQQEEERKPKPEPAKKEMKQTEPEVVVKQPATSKQQPRSRPSQFAKAVMIPPFEQIVLPIKATNLEVMIVDNSLMHYNCFGCVLLEDKANLQEIQNYLVEYEDTGREYKPKIEEYCLAKYQDGWYRAKVLELLSAEVVEVVFIDFLNESEVFIKDIRRYPMDLDLPCKTTLCIIQGLPNELTEKQVEYLKDKLQPGSQLKINEVVEKHPDGSDIAVCRINQVTQWLAEDKP
ncbi:uncharacterized protein LOC129943344 [Eupeodes corollae]|uniref:uncharacterized protein LOC129943344 n=1 Tax=Eupeodes corollae TaxID=290404 RepID=UPI0024927BDA|nr:uncharacterized protein LOC129943344 [Eupeodes corollae]